MEVYQIKNLTFTYPDSCLPAVQNITFDVQKGDFILLCGASGSGKSTMLSLLKKELMPKGHLSGEIRVFGKALSALSDFDSVSKIGYCMQSAENQQVCEYVRNELAFLPENLGLPEADIKAKLAETVSFFGMEALFNRRLSALSGGEKQLVNIAAALVSEPQVLLLDEPFAQLDVFFSNRLLHFLKRLNGELGVTILIAEHTVAPLLTEVNRIFWMQNGSLRETDAQTYLASFPKGCAPVPAVNVCNLLPDFDKQSLYPVTIQACRTRLEDYRVEMPSAQNRIEEKTPMLELKNICFRYEKNAPDVLRDLNISLYSGEVLSVIGCNGSGKTTLAGILAGQLKPYSGKRRGDSALKVFVLPQNPRLLFLFDTVVQVLNNCRQSFGVKALFQEMNQLHPEQTVLPQKEVLQVAGQLGISDLLSCNPYDLSVGQQQAVAMAILRLQSPDIVILDEPTKGMDSVRKHETERLIADLARQGKAVLHITHDINFAAEVSDRCALLFDGTVVHCENTADFLRSSRNYTSDIARIFAGTDAGNRPVSLKGVQQCAIKRKSVSRG